MVVVAVEARSRGAVEAGGVPQSRCARTIAPSSPPPISSITAYRNLAGPSEASIRRMLVGLVGRAADYRPD